MKWIKTGRTVNAEGTDIIYEPAGAEKSGITIESRKRHIPHANRGGTWDHTTYHVIQGSNELVTRYSLKDAKEFADALITTGTEEES